MWMPAMKAEAPAAAIPTPVTTAAPVVTMTPKRAPRADKYAKMAKEIAAHVVPPLIVIALLMLFWELVCRRTGSTLPPPSKVFKDTKELIFDPFFDHGGNDKGLVRRSNNPGARPEGRPGDASTGLYQCRRDGRTDRRSVP